MTSLPVAGDDVFAATRRFYDRLDGVRELLTDADRTSVRLVVNPERMVIAEARRTATYLSLFGYRVDAVVANRLLPDAITDPWFEAWKETHAEHLAAIEDGLRAAAGAQGRAGGRRAGRPRPAARPSAEALYGDADPAGRAARRRRRCASSQRTATTTCSPSRCRSPTATTSSSAATTTSCSCGSARTGGRSCCPTRSSADRSAGAKLVGEWLEVTLRPPKETT